MDNLIAKTRIINSIPPAPEPNLITYKHHASNDAPEQIIQLPQKDNSHFTFVQSAKAIIRNSNSYVP